MVTFINFLCLWSSLNNDNNKNTENLKWQSLVSLEATQENGSRIVESKSVLKKFGAIGAGVGKNVLNKKKKTKTMKIQKQQSLVSLEAT